MNWSQAISFLLGDSRAGAEVKKDLRAAGLTSRKKASAFLKSLPSHNSHRFSWNVKLYNAKLDMDSLYEKGVTLSEQASSLRALCKNDGERGLLYSYFRACYTDEIFNQATERAWHEFVTIPPSPLHLDSLDASFALVGRSAGHLVLREVGGVPAPRYEHDLEELMDEQDDKGRYTTENVVAARLFLVCFIVSGLVERKAHVEAVTNAAVDIAWETLSEDRFRELLHVYGKPRKLARQIAEAMKPSATPPEDIFSFILGLHPDSR